MSRYIDVSDLNIPSDENDYDELVAFADKVAEMITDAPTIEPKRGEWIYTDNPLRLDDEWACSRCGNISFARTNFCDRCGARMKGATDGNQ